jgi:hypothetical protein
MDDDARLSRDQEEHVIRSVEILDDRLAGLIAPPAAALLDALQGLRGEAFQDGHTLETVFGLSDRGLGHAGAG